MTSSRRCLSSLFMNERHMGTSTKIMCYYRLFIFVGCGHSTFSPTPTVFCVNAQSHTRSETERRTSSTEPTPTRNDMTSEWQLSEDHALQATPSLTSATDRFKEPSLLSANLATEGLQPCAEGRTHPFNKVKIERRCAVCEYERGERLHALETSTDEIRFEPGRWRWKYQGNNGVLATNKGDDASHFKGGGKQGSRLWGMGATVEGWWN